MRFVRVVGAALLLTAAIAGPALAGAIAADLSITKTDSPDPVAPGSNITYTITVQNAPTALTALSTQVVDTIPAGTTFVSLTYPAGWCCSTIPVGGTGTVLVAHPSVTAGSSHIITLVVQVDPATPGGTVITNTATTQTSTNETNLQNNSATTTTTVAAPAPTPAASLANAAMPARTGGSSLMILGFAVLLVATLGATAVLATQRVRP